VAQKAAAIDGEDNVLVSVGLAMGYPILINGFALKDDIDYAADLKKALDEYKSIKTPAEIAAVAAQGAIGLYRLLVTRIFIYLLVRQSEHLAKALAPAIILSLNRHIVKGVPCLKLIS
jgi:hypothetical protein